MSEYRATKKPKKVRYHFSIVFFSAVLIFGFMFWRYYNNTTLEDVLSQDRNILVPAFSQNKEDKTEDNDNNISEGEPSQPKPSANGEIMNPVAESDAKDSSYLDNCVFIGDFVAFGMASYEVVPAANVYSSINMNISKAETLVLETQYGQMTALEALEIRKPENIYLIFGPSTAAWQSSADIYIAYTSFATKVRSASPDSRIYIAAIPPVTKSKELSKESPIRNSEINNINTRLLDYANEKNYYYIDLNSYFKDETGCLPPEYAENDGLHFKYSTYDKLVSFILSHTAD